MVGKDSQQHTLSRCEVKNAVVKIQGVDQDIVSGVCRVKSVFHL